MVAFEDRRHAGRLLSKLLESYKDTDTIVYGLARGGMVVAREISNYLHLTLDVLVVKKISAPFDRELAIGAVAPDGIVFIDEDLRRYTGVERPYVTQSIEAQSRVIKSNMLWYRKGRKLRSIEHRRVLLVDDGIATGATIEASLLWFQKKGARSIVIAVPVAPIKLATAFGDRVEKIITLQTPEDFRSVGQWYERFEETSDEDVIQLLKRQSVL